jgi:hypothetical protein
MAIEKFEKTNGTCQQMDAVVNPIPFWATSHRLGLPMGNRTHFGFQNPCFMQTRGGGTCCLRPLDLRMNIHCIFLSRKISVLQYATAISAF